MVKVLCMSSARRVPEGEPIGDDMARTLAGYWQTSGSIGSHLAALATGADVAPDDVARDARATLADYVRHDIDPRKSLRERRADVLALDALARWADRASSPAAIIERMIGAGALSPAARADMSPDGAARTLDTWAGALDALEAAREAATYGVVSVVILECAHDDAAALIASTWSPILDDDAAEIVREAAEIIRSAGLRFDATGNDWATDPDGCRVNPRTGDGVARSAHIYGAGADVMAAIVDAVDR